MPDDPKRDEARMPPAILPGMLGLTGMMALDLGVWRERCALEARASARISQARTTGGIAILPMLGPVIPRSIDTYCYSIAGLDQFMARFRSAVTDPEIAAIAMRIASPGGLLDGVPEAAAEIFAARGSKPIWAIADHYAASAAYWLASAADRLIVSPSGDVGSIGVIMTHWDESKAYEDMGVVATNVTSAPFKAELSPYVPLSDEAREALQARIDTRGRQFEAEVARHRGVTAKVVRETFGRGRMVLAQDAVKLGMADAVMSFDQAVAQLARGGGRPRKAMRGEMIKPALAPTALTPRAQLAFGRRL